MQKIKQPIDDDKLVELVQNWLKGFDDELVDALLEDPFDRMEMDNFLSQIQYSKNNTREFILEEFNKFNGQIVEAPTIKNQNPPQTTPQGPAPTNNFESYVKKLDDMNDNDWQKAEEYFKNNPNAVKYDKKISGIGISFVNIEGNIYGVQTGKALGEGGFGRVKLAQNKNGEKFAIKAEGRGLRAESEAELKILKALGQLHGQAARSDYTKTFKRGKTGEKLYSILDLQKGTELTDELFYSQGNELYSHKDLSLEDRLKIALESVKSINELHKLGVVHLDIKPENFMFNREGKSLTVVPIDFGLSHKLENPNDDFVLTSVKGTNGYWAPEVASGVTYNNDGEPIYDDQRARTVNKAADVYSLGIMLQNDLQLSNDALAKMLAENPENRPTLNEIENKLEIAINNQKEFDLLKNLNSDNYESLSEQFDDIYNHYREKSQNSQQNPGLLNSFRNHLQKDNQAVFSTIEKIDKAITNGDLLTFSEQYQKLKTINDGQTFGKDKSALNGFITKMDTLVNQRQSRKQNSL